MANIAKTTFELNIGSNIESEPEIVVPNTGLYTGTMNGTNMNTSPNIAAMIFMISAILMAILSVVICIACKKIFKKSKNFALSHKKIKLLRFSSAIIFLLSLGVFGKVVVDQYFVYALDNNADVVLSSTSNIAVNMDKNNPTVSCSNVEVMLERPEQSGYTFKDYVLYMNATELKDENGNVIGAITGNVLNDNTWGYKLDESRYFQVPNTKTAIKTADWNNDIERISVDFCVQISSDVIEGKYTSVISFGATSEKHEIPQPVTNYVVTINSNGGGVVSHSMLTVPQGTVVNIGNNASFVLNGVTVIATPNSGYEFSSWTNECESSIFGNCTITANFDIVCGDGYVKNNGTCVPTTFSTITNMQEMNSTICATANVNDSKQLKDVRDGKNYWVTKLADNRCWMTQNLDFNINNSTVSYLTPAYTDVLTTWSPSPDHYTITSGDSLKHTIDTTYRSWDYWDKYYWIPPSVPGKVLGTFSTDKPSIDIDGYPMDGDHYEVGTYYQWDAVMANGNGSICPAGWSVPNIGELQNIVNTYGANSFASIQESPLYFIPSGDLSYINIGPHILGMNGSYWSSTSAGVIDSIEGAYYLLMRTYEINTTTFDAVTSVAMNVRCVAK